MDFKDYYATLGISKTASEKEVKQAFRKLARKHHPDVNPGDKAAETRFKEINEAYEVLGDADKRKKYDELGANWRAYEQAGAQGGAGFDPSQLGGWSANYRGAAGEGGAAGFARGRFGGWSANYGGGGGGRGGSGYRTMTQEEMNEMFGGE